jgi:cytokinin dehydrogenase
MDRRKFLGGVVAVSVAGFNPLTRSWVSRAEAKHLPLAQVPPLDGELVTDPSSLAAVSKDAGYHLERKPIAVLRPGSVEDISKMIKFCGRYDIPVGARGQGHTTFGQALVKGGLVIEMSHLNTIHSIQADRADVDAGVLWKDLTLQAIAQGLTPPVLTGYIALSIGGTLSVGGISSRNGRGAQVDNVYALQVVTGRGDVVWCSPQQRRDLFDATLAGLGQCGIIVRAVVALEPARAQVRNFLLHYTNNATFFADLRMLLRRGELDDVFAMWFPDGQGGWLYQMSAMKYYDPSQPPNDAHLMRGVRDFAQDRQVFDTTYLEHVLRTDVIIDFIDSIGMWKDVQHPWFDVFLPDRTVEQYVGSVLPTLTYEDVGSTGFLLLFPQKRSKFKRPLLRVPDDEWIYLFDILTAAEAPGQNPSFSRRMLARNRKLYKKARLLGGTRYSIGTLDFSKPDWILQYGPAYLPFLAAKRLYDPHGILTPGPGIF